MFCLNIIHSALNNLYLETKFSHDGYSLIKIFWYEGTLIFSLITIK